jgi:two-component system phosphate regulon sensor histidine kinase PhoR
MVGARLLGTAAFGVAAAVVANVLCSIAGVGLLAASIISGAVGLGAAMAASWVLGGDSGSPSGTRSQGSGNDPLQAGFGRQLLSNLPLALVLLDNDARVQFLNDAARELFGEVEPNEPLSSMARARPLAEAVSAVAAGGPLVAVEFTHLRAREERVLHAQIRSVEFPLTGEGSGVMILIEDHTRARKVEQMRRDFIANASHELKTPLASITGYIETLRGPAAEDADARARFLPVMADQAERMRQLVEDLMSLNRIEMNEHVRPKTELDIGVIVREAVKALAPTADRYGVTVAVELSDTGPYVIGDRNELCQLFINLMDNAIKYGGDGGRVRVHFAPAEAGHQGMVGVSVTDGGPGIARQHIPRLTERFYRISDSRSREKGGTGLGLSIVKHIVNRHRGDLTIRSNTGEGATFTAWLPVYAHASAAKES